VDQIPRRGCEIEKIKKSKSPDEVEVFTKQSGGAPIAARWQFTNGWGFQRQSATGVVYKSPDEVEAFRNLILPEEYKTGQTEQKAKPAEADSNSTETQKKSQ
jgi:hypothetical protein